MRIVYTMSSTVRQHGSIIKTTKFQHIKTPSYYDNVAGADVPFPFKYENGVLDINIQDNVVNDLINDFQRPDNYSNFLVKNMGGTGLVQSLGPNMLAWLDNWLGDSYGTAITDVSVYTPGVMTKVQAVLTNDRDRGQPLNNFFDVDPYGITVAPPSSDEYIFAGSDANNWRSSWIFQSPLTIRFLQGGSPRYLILNSTYCPQWND